MAREVESRAARRAMASAWPAPSGERIRLLSLDVLSTAAASRSSPKRS
jgi:hypothetical protein